MMVQWFCMPVCVRLVDKKGSGGSDSFSGVHLVMLEEGKRRTEMVVTLSYMQNVSSSKRILVNCSEVNSSEKVNWYLGRCVFEGGIFGGRSEAAEFLGQLKSMGFSLLPNDNFNSSIQAMQLLVIELVNNSFWELGGLNGHEKLEFGTAAVGEEINIFSCPFNLTNSLLFSQFQLNGSINLAVAHSGPPELYLVDTRYLDNMIGGLVNTSKRHNSIGLVLGNLRKQNGDGDLTAVLPWSVIWKHLEQLFSCGKTPVFPEVSTNSGLTNKCVLPLVVKHGFNSSWGSCIYLKEGSLVTNYHVIQAFVEEPEVKCTIHLDDGNIVELGRYDKVHTPYRKLDLAFIELSPQNISKLAKSGCIPTDLAQDYKEGEEVRTVGYGLFFNKSYIKPLISQGIISRVFSLPVQQGATKSLPSLVITSSSCWNGSSGGGLFNRYGGLIGLICSNAQVFSPFAEERSASKIEKVSKFAFCLPVELLLAVHDIWKSKDRIVLNYKIENLWALECDHLDDVIEGPKL